MLPVFQLLIFENLTPFNWEVVQKALTILWQGLLAIFVVIGLIVVTVKITGFVIRKIDEASKRRKDEHTDDDKQ